MSSDRAKRNDTDNTDGNAGNTEKPRENSNLNHELVQDDFTILYQCNFCELSYRNKADMDVHLKPHSGSKVYECTECQTSFSNVNEWLNHLLKHTEKDFKCIKCSETFRYLTDLVKHLESHDYEKLYQCQLCEYTSPKPFNFTSHLITHTKGRSFRENPRLHSEDNEFKCISCKKNFENRKSLKMHINSKTGCVKKFTEQSNQTEVVSPISSSSRWLCEVETFSKLVTTFGLISGSISAPKISRSPGSKSVETAVSGLESQFDVAKCSGTVVSEVLTYSRNGIECTTKNFTNQQYATGPLPERESFSQREYVPADGILTRMRALKERGEVYGTPTFSGPNADTEYQTSSRHLSSTDTSTHAVPRSKEDEEMYHGQSMQSEASPSGNLKTCTRSLSELPTPTENETSVEIGECNLNVQQDKNVASRFQTTPSSKHGNDVVPEVHLSSMTLLGRETEFESEPFGDFSTFFGTEIDGISSLPGSPSLSDLVDDSTLWPQYPASLLDELSTTELSSVPWAHSALEPNLETQSEQDYIFLQASSSPDE